MGLMKRALMELSDDMGCDGEVTDEVLAEAKANPARFAAAAREMRTNLGLPAAAEADGGWAPEAVRRFEAARLAQTLAEAAARKARVGRENAEFRLAEALESLGPVTVDGFAYEAAECGTRVHCYPAASDFPEARPGAREPLNREPEGDSDFAEALRNAAFA